MIKKLQRKFITITMGSLLAVMLLMIGAINAVNILQIQAKMNESLDYLVKNQGKFPMEKKGPPPGDNNPLFKFGMNEETPFQTRYFAVELFTDKTVKQIDTSHIAAVSSAEAMDYAIQVMDSNKTSGFKGIYKYRLVKQEDGYMVIFLDGRDKLQNITEILIISCMVAAATLILMFLLITSISKRAMKPFIENSEKQKLFITDAGHEIKTPLAIISANADVLELMNGESEWITSIRNQTGRLDKLVKNLLMLSKFDEEGIKRVYQEFNLSETVEKMAGPFAAVANAGNRKFYMEIQPDIRLMGDEDSIEQLITTLVDNAIKYCSEEGIIRISLSILKKEKKLTVYNTVDNLDTKNLDRLFDRFYRMDSSRSRETGGYGIGLSIAKSVAEAHHGKITVKSENGKSIQFTVTFS